MRVVAGRFKGQRLTAPRRAPTRPTQDRVREALFSILGSVEDLRVLDLYAGSGALGIEALSRGASEATFVDFELEAVRSIRRNAARLGISTGSRREAGPQDSDDSGRPASESEPAQGQSALVTRAGVGPFLRRAAKRADRWDLVFCDPPYRLAHRLADDLDELLVPVLAAEARVVCESSFRQPLKLGLPPITERRYSDTLVAVYRAPPPQQPDDG